MYNEIAVKLLTFYGFFLIVSGIVSVLLIGARAKTALLSGGTAGSIALVLAFLSCQGYEWAVWIGLIWPLLLLVVFSWRSAKTLFQLFELIVSKDELLKGKGIAFLIISLMAIVSLVVFMLQVVFLKCAA
jgi:uncharacterized membrane protein (UPF0136 family)